MTAADPERPGKNAAMIFYRYFIRDQPVGLARIKI